MNTHRTVRLCTFSWAGSLVLSGALACSLSWNSSAIAGDAISYTRDVRPILAAKCFACHGPDKGSRQGDLRLDTQAGATAKREGRPALQPGAPDKSELIHRITSHDPDERMPPPEANKVLTPTEIETLRRWIAAGGNYEQHWAFVEPKLPAIPAVKNRNWPRNDIDPFVLSRLEPEGLAPAPQAEPLTLVRRLYLDLIGLPPTPQEADAWAARLTADVSTGDSIREDVYAELVDHLLQSPHYGERWARKWLDLARYADTNGYEKDRPRSIWPYRDWVIRALNSDMPFNQFTIEQIAGDMLPKATQDQMIATGFHRNTMLNEEGGIDPQEYRFYSMTDRVATTGTTWLGLTIGCAQCHTHKFDPITHRDYYRFMALLDNADEPEQDLISPETTTARQRQLAEADKLLKELPQMWPGANAAARRVGFDKAFEKWLTTARARMVTWNDLRPIEMKSNLPYLAVEGDNSIFVSGDISKDDTYELTFADAPAGVTAIRLEALPDDRLPAHGPGMAYYEGPKGEFFLGEFQAFQGERQLTFSKASESYAKNHFGNGPASAALATDGNPETGWACSDRYGEAHQAVFVLAKSLTWSDSPAEANQTTGLQPQIFKIKLRFGRYYAASLGRFRISVSTAAGAVAQDVPREIEQLLKLQPDKLGDAQRQQLREHFLLQAPELAQRSKKIKELRRASTATTSLVMRERPAENLRKTFRRHRGEYLQPKEEVTAGVPEFLPPLPAGAATNRLALARWLVGPDNPLTARVVVNRQWGILFGQGLVRTSGDFGQVGEPPTHPQLLDWLACKFVEDGWSLKRLHRRIVSSATYRQSSRISPELLAKDPQNRLLARGPRVRLDAEIVRDMALRASGLLSEKMYGSPVRPPQPPGAQDGAFGDNSWPTSSGEDRYRRGIYTHYRRATPYAMFSIFDGASGETCLAQRDVSNTPLQALTLLNDEVFMEAAVALGKIAAAEQGTDAEKAARLMRRCIIRQPQSDEVQRMLEFLNTQRQRLGTEKIAMAPFVSPGETPTAQRAAWTLLARAVLNLDETITRN
ncbi:MAG: PSD1 and planctomycete cytochrome C domain-containing protein [Planctomycetes bacterium]|nr:PSD1 and planctomycete cytochrome C domain-containing protein [Planctomycetota bacterium]